MDRLAGRRKGQTGRQKKGTDWRAEEMDRLAGRRNGQTGRQKKWTDWPAEEMDRLAVGTMAPDSPRAYSFCLN